MTTNKKSCMRWVHLLLISYALSIQSCSNGDDEKNNTATPVDHFIHCMDKADYKNIERDFSQQMKRLWNNGTFSNSIIKIRESSGEPWFPELQGKEDHATEEGLLTHYNFTVKGDKNSRYSLMITTIIKDAKENIVGMTLFDTPTLSHKPPMNAQNKTPPIMISPSQRGLKE